MRKSLRPCAALSACLALLVCSKGLADEPVAVVSPDSPLPRVVAGKSRLEKDAAADFCAYLSRVSGRKIAVSRKAENDDVIIHVGRDRFVEEHAPEIERIRADGYLLKCVEHGGSLHLILAGKVDRASQWAVERFLREYCGVRWLFPDPVYGEVVPQRTTITIDRRLSETVEPDYVSRANCSMYFFSPPRRLLRLGPFGHGYGGHAIQHIFSENEFRRHPDWFAQFDGKRQWWSYGNGWQICTTHPGTVQRAVEYVDAFFKKNPHAPVVSIGQNDGNGWCECARCTKFVNSFSPPYTLSDRWFHWVNLVAREVDKKHAGKWVEAMAYANTSEPPRFKLEPNVAVTKTFVLDSEFKQAEKWKAVCKSVNLYSYMYGASFLGFRHYPHAAQGFLKWGHAELGALAHVTECGGDWTFDGPKYYYLQALQWNVNADVDQIMDEFCAASYGEAAKPMRTFWDRLEEIYERRKPGPYRKYRKDWLFYQWVSWAANSYVQPNDELRDYTLEDVEFLDRCVADARRLIAADNNAADNNAARFRLQRVAEAWRFQRSLLVSYLKFYPAPLDVTVASEQDAKAALQRAREIVEVRRQRADSLARMRSFPHINPRIADPAYWSYGSASTIFSHEHALLDELCAAVTKHLGKTTGRADEAVAYWRAVARDDNLYNAAQTQLALLTKKEAPHNRLVNGDFEAGDLRGWTIARGQLTATREQPRSGTFSAGAGGGAATLSQKVAVSAFERLRLTAWGRYAADPPDTSVPLEATLEFYDGQQQIFAEPARAVMRTLDPAAGWVRLRLAATAPARADSAVIKLKRTFNGNTRWDDVALERIKRGPPITHGSLTDRFDRERLDSAKWSRMPAQGGWKAPVTRDGWLVLSGDGTFPIASLARFNELLQDRGPDRYRLRLHVAAPASTTKKRPGQAAFSITSSRPPLTRMLWYLYFSGPDRTRPMLSCFNDQAGVRKFSSSWNMTHLEDRGADIWCTFYFDPVEVTVFASADRYDESEESLVCRYKHGLTDMKANGSVYLTLYNGAYRVDELSLTRARRLNPPRSLPPRPR